MALVVTVPRGAVRTIRMDRPGARNAMDTALLEELVEAFADAAADGDTRCIVFTGAGAAFSAGADLKESLDEAADTRRMDLFCRLFEDVAGCRVPTVAAIRGPCIGGGAELATACDLRVAEVTASFRFPGAQVGYPVGVAKLVALVGLGAAKDLVLTARTVPAEEAARLGLVQRLVADDQAMATALELAEQIAAHDPATIGYMQRLFDRFTQTSERVAVESDALRALVRSGRDYDALAPRHRGADGWPGAR